MITRTFKLCLNAGTGSAPYINVNQYDEGETWLFELYTEQGERYLPTTGAIVGIKSDGHGIANTGTVDSNGRVVITETEQMTAAAGRAIFELSIDGLTHGTANFIVMVERKPTEDAVMSDSDYSMFQEVIDAAEVIEDVIGDGDPSEVIGEHVDAWLDNHPEATTTVQDGAITAPKINNSLWDKLLVSEEASGAVASFDDGADDVPVSSLKVALEPIQTGTGDPSPSNIRPIVASNGKNLADFVNGYTVDASGNVVGYGTRIATVNPITIKSGVSYKVIFSGNATGAIYAVFNGSTLVRRLAGVTSGTVLDTSGGTDLYVCVYAGESTTVTVDSSHAMVVDSSITDFTYQPYQGIMVERTGKNKLPSGDGYTNRGVTKSVNSDGSITLTGTATQLVDMSLVSSPVLETGVPYRMVIDKATGWNGTGNVLYAIISNGSTNRYVGCGSSSSTLQTTFTLASDEYVGNCFLRVASGVNTGGQTVKVMIIKDGESTSYEPYTSTSYPYTLGQSVYGGTVDLATGVLTVTHKCYTASQTSDFERNSEKSYYVKPGIISDSLRNGNTNNIAQSDKFKSWRSGISTNADGIIFLNGSGAGRFNTVAPYNSVSEMLTGIGGSMQIYYPLATPTTVQLTPQEVKTLLGYNNISSSGTVDVIYHADTKLYVDKMTNVDNAIIAPTEADFVATRNYTVNDLVIVADTLYKVTANIASGSTITPNSNVQQTTLSALIKALS